MKNLKWIIPLIIIIGVITAGIIFGLSKQEINEENIVGQNQTNNESQVARNK